MTCGRQARIVRQTPIRLTSITRSNTRVLRAEEAGATIPAHANTVSIPPSASTVPSTAASSASPVGDVGLEGHGAGAVGGDRLEVAEADERHARAAGGEAAGGLGADPVRGAGDEDGLAGEGSWPRD